MRFSLALAAALAIASTGCSTKVLIESDPSGADVFINGKLRGQTPYTHGFVNVGGYYWQEIRVEKDGYVPAIGKVDRYMTWYLTYAWSPDHFIFALKKREEEK